MQRARTQSGMDKVNTERIAMRKARSYEKHGARHTKIYDIWRDMIYRCRRPTHKSFKYYGGRGIKVCDRWRIFSNFFSDVGNKPEGMSIDRINNLGNYEPSNCRWATRKEQQRNTKKSVFVTYMGQTRCVSEWAEIFSISPYVMRGRLKAGWPIRDALTKSVRKYTISAA